MKIYEEFDSIITTRPEVAEIIKEITETDEDSDPMKADNWLVTLTAARQIICERIYYEGGN